MTFTWWWLLVVAYIGLTWLVVRFVSIGKDEEEHE